MSAAQAQIIETQQRTIKRLERELSEIRRIASECESVKIGELSACATQILNNKQPVAITRYSHREAVIIPAELLGV